MRIVKSWSYALGFCALLLVFQNCTPGGFTGGASDDTLGGPPSQPASSGEKWKQVASGKRHACLLKSDGQVWCWGSNEDGRLGNNSTQDSVIPVQVQGLPGLASSIAIGESYGCALVGNKIFCWGSNDFGQLGNNSTQNSLTPVEVQSVHSSGYQAISGGGSHMCAISNSAAYCWGWGVQGQLGNNTNQNSLVPSPVVGMTSGMQALSAGPFIHSCGIQNGNVFCWGYNSFGQLGNNSQIDSPVPVAVQGLPAGQATAISVGNDFSCATTSQGLYCWGFNNMGQVGDNSNVTSRLTAVPVTGAKASDLPLSVGLSHSCTIKEGSAFCWGDNSDGALGDSTTTDRNMPTAVQGISSKVRKILAGNCITCALTEKYEVFCWGLNDYGQLGNNSGASSPTPVRIQGI
jgi:alpha-tubulin suppressor-like RCC1 family protein